MNMSGLSLLIVDDEEAARYGMRRALETFGCEIAEAGSAEALAPDVGREAPADARLGAQQRIEGAVRKRIAGHERHGAVIMAVAADGGTTADRERVEW